MQMQTVESSSIKAVGHDPISSTLRVQFHNGGVYEYHGVTAEQHKALLGADSIGRHFHAHVRKHSFTKL